MSGVFSEGKIGGRVGSLGVGIWQRNERQRNGGRCVSSGTPFMVQIPNQKNSPDVVSLVGLLAIMPPA